MIALPWALPGLQEAAAREAARAARSGRPFVLLRLAPTGWAARDDEVRALARIVASALRVTDGVHPAGREVGVVLVETSEAGLQAPLSRLREEAGLRMPGLLLRVGWAVVGPGQSTTWQEAWRWAGRRQITDGAIPAAA